MAATIIRIAATAAGLNRSIVLTIVVTTAPQPAAEREA
jgi:hypothetical protein